MHVPPMWPVTQLSGSGFGQNGSTRKCGGSRVGARSAFASLNGCHRAAPIASTPASALAYTYLSPFMCTSLPGWGPIPSPIKEKPSASLELDVEIIRYLIQDGLSNIFFQ